MIMEGIWTNIDEAGAEVVLKREDKEKAQQLRTGNRTIHNYGKQN